MEENNTSEQSVESERSVGEKKGFNPLYFIGGLVVIGLVGGFLAMRGGEPSVQSPVPETPTNETTKVGSQGAQLSDISTTVVPADSVKEFNIDGKSFEFSPKTLTVNKGDTVKINFTDSDGMHDLVIEGYNLRTKVVRPGGSDTLTFVADKVGSFKYYCSVANHEELGMTGTLVVQ